MAKNNLTCYNPGCWNNKTCKYMDSVNFFTPLNFSEMKRADGADSEPMNVSRTNRFVQACEGYLHLDNKIIFPIVERPVNEFIQEAIERGDLPENLICKMYLPVGDLVEWQRRIVDAPLLPLDAAPQMPCTKSE